jgi:arylsulfatase A-like enzyme
MKKLTLWALATACLLTAAPRKPKLILAVVVDQFRYDYLTRYRSEYHAGLDRLLTQGAVFTSGSYIHVPTVTAVGHSTFLSGAIPSISGIVANDWYDRDEKTHVTSVSDAAAKLLGGGAGPGSSPRRLLVSTLGDELKMANGGKSHVAGVSLKDRAAILPSGHMADGAYWFDPKSGSFVSSTYYFPELPGWVADFDKARPADRYRGVTWLNHKLPENLKELYDAIDASPFGNELVESFAELALDHGQLGRHDGPDLLAVSFSSNDYVGHEYGPESPEAHEVALRTDIRLDKLFQAAARQAGAENVLVVFTADHGAAPVPEVNTARKMPGGRITLNSVRDAVQVALVKKFGAGQWVAGNWDLTVYLNEELMAQKNLDPGAVEREAARAIFSMPHIFRVYTRQDLIRGQALPDEITRRVVNGFNVRRGPDVEYLPDPYWIIRDKTTGTGHATPFGYDAHVPMIFMGAGIKAGRYDFPVTVNDIAPTLAALMDVETPSGSVGRVLTEIFQQ